MIVISAGMQKAGTGWYFHLTNDLLATHGGNDIRELRSQSRLARRHINAHNGGIGNANARRLAALTLLHATGRTFAVKTHVAPSRVMRLLLASRAVRATYCYRDLRDVALSALDRGLAVDGTAGKRIGQVTTLEDALRFAGTLLPTWRAWTSLPGVLVVRYEDLRADPAAEIERLAHHLGVALSDREIQGMLERYPAGSAGTGVAEELHFNRGETGRFRRELETSDLRLCDRILGPSIDEMGYEPAI